MGLIKHLDISHNIRQLMSNWGLLIILTFTIFVLPLLTSFVRFRLFEIFITLIVLISTIATSEKGKPKVVFQVIIAFVAIWITRIANLEVINYLATMWLVVFFMLRVLKYIRRLSRKAEVNSLVIIEAINGYLLIGVGFGILIDMVTYQFAGAFNFGEATQINHIYDSFYYTFVSMTTLGYGDLLPVTPVAKSLALMITLCGQFYLVIIMALLVGRLLISSDGKD